LAPERATVDQVRDRLKQHKVKTAQAKNDVDFETRMEKLKEADKKENEPNKKKKKKKQKEEPVEKIPIEDASELAGFGLPMGFGTSKR
jgi:predicted  nucleic acid-binding Zn-ribbon protein